MVAKFAPNSALSDPLYAIRILYCRWCRRTPVKRWLDVRSFDESWDSRTESIAALIPKNSRVIEFGAGRRKMASYLDPSCTYIPSDLFSRGPGTIVFDLNQRPLPDLRHLKLDVAVFGGVLEYVFNVRSIAHWLFHQTPLCIASYECAVSKRHTAKRVREVLSRSRLGWVNHYDEEELRELFETAGFGCQTRVIWDSGQGEESIFVFQRNLGDARESSPNRGDGERRTSTQTYLQHNAQTGFERRCSHGRKFARR